MSISCLAFIGKGNEPLFVYTEAEDAESLQLHSIVHCALDIFEEKRGKKSSNNASPSSSTDLYLGQLYAIEDYRVFGYCTNTMIKIITVCDASIKEADLTETFQNFHSEYVTAVQNPFQPVGRPVVSHRFPSKLRQIIKKFNANRRGSKS